MSISVTGTEVQTNNVQNTQRKNEVAYFLIDEGDNSTYVGFSSTSRSADIMTARDTTVIGHEAGKLVLGNLNTFYGSYAGTQTGTGYENTFIGAYSGTDNTTAARSTYIGAYAGNHAKGSLNTFLGYRAGELSEGTNNILIGTGAGSTSSAKSTNNAIVIGNLGRSAGSSTGPSAFVSGEYGIAIGNGARDTSGESNAIIMGHNSTTSKQNSMVLGNNISNFGCNVFLVQTSVPYNRPYVNNENDIININDRFIMGTSSANQRLELKSDNVMIGSSNNGIQMTSSNTTFIGPNLTFSAISNITLSNAAGSLSIGPSNVVLNASSHATIGADSNAYASFTNDSLLLSGFSNAIEFYKDGDMSVQSASNIFIEGQSSITMVNGSNYFVIDGDGIDISGTTTLHDGVFIEKASILSNVFASNLTLTNTATFNSDIYVTGESVLSNVYASNLDVSSLFIEGMDLSNYLVDFIKSNGLGGGGGIIGVSNLHDSNYVCPALEDPFYMEFNQSVVVNSNLHVAGVACIEKMQVGDLIFDKNSLMNVNDIVVNGGAYFNNRAMFYGPVGGAGLTYFVRQMISRYGGSGGSSGSNNNGGSIPFDSNYLVVEELQVNQNAYLSNVTILGNIDGSGLDKYMQNYITSTNFNNYLTNHFRTHEFPLLSNLSLQNITSQSATLTNLKSSNVAFSNVLANNFNAETTHSSNIYTSNLNSTNAAFTNLFSQIISASNVSASNLEASIITSIIQTSSNITSSNINATNSYFVTATASNIVGSIINTSNAIINNATFSNLSSSNITSSNIYSKLVGASDATITNVTLSNATLSNATITNGSIVNATFLNASTSNLQANDATFSNVHLLVARVSNLETSNAYFSNSVDGPGLSNFVNEYIHTAVSNLSIQNLDVDNSTYLNDLYVAGLVDGPGFSNFIADYIQSAVSNLTLSNLVITDTISGPAISNYITTLISELAPPIPTSLTLSNLEVTGIVTGQGFSNFLDVYLGKYTTSQSFSNYLDVYLGKYTTSQSFSNYLIDFIKLYGGSNSGNNASNLHNHVYNSNIAHPCSAQLDNDYTTIETSLVINDHLHVGGTACFNYVQVSYLSGSNVILGGQTTLGDINVSGSVSFSPNNLPVAESNYDDWWRQYVQYNSNSIDLIFQSKGGTLVTFQDEFFPEVLNFTGKHRCSMASTKQKITDANLDKHIGLIAISAGRYENLKEENVIGIDEAIPMIDLSTEQRDKRVFGVIGGVEREGKFRIGNMCFQGTARLTRTIVQSSGEGGIWVCDANGPLQNGDYITTSEVRGIGMRQTEDYNANYTVAKITCDCTFDLKSDIYKCIQFTFKGRKYTKAFVGCIYCC